MADIHYHGTPIWGGRGSVHRIAVSGAGAFVSYARPDQLRESIRYAMHVGIDNAAFSAWRRGLVVNWNDFYQWLLPHYHHPKVKFFVIPDVVEGGEHDNDQLIKQLPKNLKEKAAPVWHLHESIDRLVELCRSWPRVCFGSSGQYASIRTEAWHGRMQEAFEAIYSRHSFKTKIHGLRMLDGRVLGNYPLSSADSTNLACNIPKFNAKYPDLTKNVIEADYSKGLSEEALNLLIKQSRCAVLKGAIEKVIPPSVQEWAARPAMPKQFTLEGI